MKAPSCRWDPQGDGALAPPPGSVQVSGAAAGFSMSAVSRETRLGPGFDPHHPKHAGGVARCQRSRLPTGQRLRDGLADAHAPCRVERAEDDAGAEPVRFRASVEPSNCRPSGLFRLLLHADDADYAFKIVHRRELYRDLALVPADVDLH